MVFPMSLRPSIMALCLLAMSFLASANDQPLTREEMQSTLFVETVAIPSPGEFFLALDKECQPNWTQFDSPPAASTADREFIAIQLGILMTDGYIAVQARDAQDLRNIGIDILVLAKKLNASQNLLTRSQSIGDFAEKGDWKTLREELDASQNDVRLALIEQMDYNLVTLAATSAWVRQMGIAAKVLVENYKPAPSALLVQPALAGHFLARLRSLPERNRNSPIVQQFITGIESALSEMELASASFMAKPSVEKIAITMSGLTTLAFAPPAKP
jgi:hypothetical protein